MHCRKDGFDWITLNVIFQGPKGLKKVKFGCFWYFLPIYSKAVWLTFLYFLYTASLGWYWSTCQEMVFIELFKRSFSRSERSGLAHFSHNYWYYSIVTKCCPNLLHHVAFWLWNQSCPKIWKVWRSERSNLDLCDLLQRISRKRYIVYDESLYEIHIVSHIWPFSLPDKIWPWMSLKGQIKVKWHFSWLLFINEACCV